ncbi:MAG: DUF5060 domain-containing protein, partial [Anaerolineae bacterium]|nr:DUF5060 domain-containing protein [Anaerolineae bacterium]
MEKVHIWEKVELTFYANNHYENPYTDVDVWVDLQGPGFSRRCYGFWEGGNVFKVRVTANVPGTWQWISGCSSADTGMTGVKGRFTAIHWTDEDLVCNPNRRGMIRPSENGHAFTYADGAPYFLL